MIARLNVAASASTSAAADVADVTDGNTNEGVGGMDERRHYIVCCLGQVSN